MRIRAAMENGFLNARCRKGQQLLREYGLWCWRMGLPLVWYEPRSRHSRLNRVRLDLFTTPGTLSIRGRAALIALSARYVNARDASISPLEAVWDRVEPQDVAGLARAVFRTVRRNGHYEIAPRAEESTNGARVLEFPIARSA